MLLNPRAQQIFDFPHVCLDFGQHCDCPDFRFQLVPTRSLQDMQLVFIGVRDNVEVHYCCMNVVQLLLSIRLVGIRHVYNERVIYKHSQT